MVICLERDASDLHMTPSSLAAVKSRMAYLSGAGLSTLSWKKAVEQMYCSRNSSWCLIGERYFGLCSMV